VFVPGEDAYKPVVRKVTIGLEGEEFVEIRGGLTASTKVLVRSRSTAEDGAEDEEVDPETGESEEGGGGHPAS
jgi:HlyD family secretion protein